MSDQDISHILKSWGYDPHKNVRVIKSAKGRLLIQVRHPLGLEQYEMTGRPDGKTFGNYKTYLGFLRERYTGTSDIITEEEFTRLQEEGILYYQRYVLLFQLNDYSKVIRDTDHNLALCDFLVDHGGDFAPAVLQFQPYILRMNALAQSMLLIQTGASEQASKLLRTTRDVISNLEEIDSPAFKMEQKRALEQIDSTLEQMVSDLEAGDSELDVLEKQLQEAVESEDYERAALLRDQIQNRNRIDKQ